jgi:hypothetical protein
LILLVALHGLDGALSIFFIATIASRAHLPAAFCGKRLSERAE